MPSWLAHTFCLVLGGGARAQGTFELGEPSFLPSRDLRLVFLLSLVRNKSVHQTNFAEETDTRAKIWLVLLSLHSELFLQLPVHLANHDIMLINCPVVTFY